MTICGKDAFNAFGNINTLSRQVSLCRVDKKKKRGSSYPWANGKQFINWSLSSNENVSTLNGVIKGVFVSKREESRVFFGACAERGSISDPRLEEDVWPRNKKRGFLGTSGGFRISPPSERSGNHSGQRTREKRVFSSANNDSKGKTISVFWTGSVFAENKMEEL